MLFFGATMWSAWLVSVVCGPGLFDLAGNVKGADFIEFYTAGEIVRRGNADRLYDLELQERMEHDITAPRQSPGFHGFLNPPFFAVLFVPFAALPYLRAFALWSALGFGLLLATFALLARVQPSWRGRWGSAIPWLLTFVPIFAAVSYGQNSLLSLFVLAAAFTLLKTGHDLHGGLVLGLLLYKPRLLVVLTLVLLLDRRWRTLLGMGVTSALLAALAVAVSLPAARAWMELSRALLALPVLPRFPIWKMHSLYSFFVLLLPRHLRAAACLALVAAVITFVAVRTLQPSYRADSLHRWYAAALWGTVLISPHVFIYDLSVLVLAGALLWEEWPRDLAWMGSIAALWLAVTFSGMLAQFQHATVGPSLQLSVPVIAAVGYRLLREIR